MVLEGGEGKISHPFAVFNFCYNCAMMEIPDLFPYQIEGAKFLTNRRAKILGDEMGLGKSAQAITAADDSGAKRILIICPAVARENWKREFEKFSSWGRNLQVIHKGSDVPLHGDSLVYSYDLAARHLERLAEQKFDVLILDEAHFLKNPLAIRTKAILGRTGLVRNCDKVWALTGTPMPNHPGELWPLLYTFGATKKPYDDFVERYCEVITTGYGNGREYQKIVGMKEENASELQWLLSRVMLRRKKKEVLKDLPEVFVNSFTVERGKVPLTADMSAQLQEELASLELELANVSPAHAMSILEARAQSVSTLRRYIGLQKVEPAIELVISEIGTAYTKLVVFCVHRDVANALESAFKKAGLWPAVITGDTPGSNRHKEVDRFQRDKRCQVFIGNIGAAGTAITLTASSEVLFVEEEWTPAANEQALARCHRIGQTRNVNVRVLAVADSIDERITAVLRRKNSDIKALFG